MLYMYAVLSFALLHESFFLANSRFQLHCENLAQCFVSVIRYGLLNTLGAVRILYSMSDRSFIISHAQKCVLATLLVSLDKGVDSHGGIISYLVKCFCVPCITV